MTEKQRKFYHSKKWLQFRQVVIMERQDENGQSICEYCGQPIAKPYDLVIHHKIELTDDNVDDAAVTLNPENVQIVHFQCHNKIHERFSSGARPSYKWTPHHVYLVYGPPLSGKSTFVKENAKAGDLVVDIDSVWECISGQPRYTKPAPLKGTAFDLRDWLYDRVRCRAGKWQDAYVIAGVPEVGERERLMVRLNVDRDILITTDEKTCYERAFDRCTDAAGQIDEEMFNAQTSYVRAWFERYQPNTET